ncbi:LysM peptidoglycan-binding domain-containing protein [Domibacillus indicus]|uniref:LysM peptidoglycan-binding domain-containing protein n=1 Tax=Domibacillus indicus TaxID=1437523 RepID=UPI00203AFCE1|nr:LysM domain-containing protein [Domibacillus indicus]MCM3789420.1 LysM peptidoglycan-binding domain-containing protein [Domibacillus indicus]
MNKLNFDITFRHNKTGEYLTLPVLPIDGKITYNYGDTRAVEADIVELGSVEFPLGTELDSMTISSFFPGKHDPGIVRVRPTKLSKPLSYQEKFLEWKKMRNSIQVIIPAAGINSRMYISSYVPDHGRGRLGHIFYTLELREYREVKAEKVSPIAGTVKKKATPKTRTPVPAKKMPQTYTVKVGDSVTLIAKKFKIADWYRMLYLPNRKVIGPNPDNLKVGVKLVIP